LGGTLKVRIAYVQAKFTNLLMPSDASSEEMYDVMRDAEEWGHCYYRNDEHEPPALFRDEPALLQAWQYGYNFAAESAEMAKCSSCNDGTGNPCPCHG
jgi:hypothetical protein